MKYIDEFRDRELVKELTGAIHATVTQPWTLMEICGGQTHSIMRFGLDQLLPDSLTLVHGPGCPVCVTPVELVDQAIHLASRDDVILCTFGDMVRVPGSETDLMQVKAGGGDVRMVYSPLDAVRIAEQNPEREVVFFAVGFETTAPANAMSVFQAREQGRVNYSVLVSQVLVPPAMELILSSPDNRVQGFLAAGHVCTVTGYQEYEALARKHRIPIVVTGFEPVDILQGVLSCVEQLEAGTCEVENAYARAVRPEGNSHARGMIESVFEVVDRKWRGVGEIPRSGLDLKTEYEHFDARKKFGLTGMEKEESGECISGLVLQGIKKPNECPAFGTRCTPDHPLGATMVSNEGACAAYYRYRREPVGEDEAVVHSVRS
jgi:hydrogenase expression/formation protein HypD